MYTVINSPPTHTLTPSPPPPPPPPPPPTTHTHTHTQDDVIIGTVEEGSSDSRQTQIANDEVFARELQEQFDREASVTHIPPSPHIWSARGVSVDCVCVWGGGGGGGGGGASVSSIHFGIKFLLDCNYM